MSDPPESVNPQTNIPLVDRSEVISDFHLDGYCCPPGFRVTEGGIDEERHRNDGDIVFVRFTTQYVIVRAVYRDIVDGTLMIDLSWTGDKGWWTQAVPRQEIADTKSIVQLSRFGLFASTANAMPLVKYLGAFLVHNRNRLREQPVTKNMGWQGPNGELGFLWGETLIARGTEPGPRLFTDATDGTAEIVAAYHAKGSLEEWQRGAQMVLPYPKVAVALFASVASVLLVLLPAAANFIIDWGGQTSGGKTTALRVAGSFWGFPHTDHGVIRSWNVSRTYLERIAGCVGNMPIILDDTKLANDESELAQFVYDFVCGQGRGRATVTGLTRTASWRAVMLSTGEAAITDYSKDGGTRARVIAITGIPFESTDRGDLAVAIKAIMTANYGHAGPMIVRWLQTPGVRDQVQQFYMEWKDYWLTKAAGHEIASRAADYFAVLAVGGQILNHLFQLGDNDDTLRILNAVWDLALPRFADAEPSLRAYEETIAWAIAHQEEFYCRRRAGKGGVRAPNSGWIGAWAPGSLEIAFIPTRLRAELERMGYEYETVVRTWKERGLLIHDRGRSDTKRKVGEQRPGCIVLLIPDDRLPAEPVVVAPATVEPWTPPPTPSSPAQGTSAPGPANVEPWTPSHAPTPVAELPPLPWTVTYDQPTAPEPPRPGMVLDPDSGDWFDPSEVALYDPGEE